MSKPPDTRTSPGVTQGPSSTDTAEGLRPQATKCQGCGGDRWIETDPGMVPCPACNPAAHHRWAEGHYAVDHRWWSCPSCHRGQRDDRGLDRAVRDHERRLRLLE